MRRIRLEPPTGKRLAYLSMDSIHDAAIAALDAAGVPVSRLIGPEAAPWGAGAVFSRPAKPGRDERVSRAVVVSTTDAQVADALGRLDPATMRSTRSGTGEEVDLSGWTVIHDPAPVAEGTDRLGVFCGTPVAITRKGDRTGGRWLFDVREGDLQSAVNCRLSRIHGREVSLRVQPDEAYVESRRSHAIFCKVKADKGPGNVVGLSLPLILSGSREDLELAWYAGIGEKTRMGFGILCAA